MSNFCSVPGCASKTSFRQLFDLPQEPDRRLGWLKFLTECGKKIVIGAEYKICKFTSRSNN